MHTNYNVNKTPVCIVLIKIVTRIFFFIYMKMKGKLFYFTWKYLHIHNTYYLFMYTYIHLLFEMIAYIMYLDISFVIISNMHMHKYLDVEWFKTQNVVYLKFKSQQKSTFCSSHIPWEIATNSESIVCRRFTNIETFK